MRRSAVLLLLAAFCLLLSALGLFFHRDNFSTHYPIKVISASAFRAGEIPWWNPFDGGGQPLAGNPNTLTFYPDNFLYLLLPAHVAFNLHFLLHLIAAWFAMRALSRSPWSGWLYVLSGVAISATAFYNLIVAIAVIPFAFWAAPRRIIEMILGPWIRIDDPHLFLTLFIGIIAIPALWQRSRYVAIAAVSLFFALGRFNPLFAGAVNAIPQLRILRFPEKFAIPMT